MLVALLLWVAGQLNLGFSVSGFGTALATALVMGAYGLVIWLVGAAWQVLAPGDVPFLLIWVGSAGLLWLSAKFIPGVELRNFLWAFVIALVVALMWVGVQAIVGLFVP